MGFLKNLFGRQKEAPAPDAHSGVDRPLSVRNPAPAEVGVLFDVQGLGGGFYGQKAYKVFFANIDPTHLKGCTVYDGDPLAISSDQYCICVNGASPEQVEYVRRAMGGVEAPGLLPVARRFATGRVAGPNYLVEAGFVDSDGAFNVQKNSIVAEGWGDGTPWTIRRRT